MTDVPTVGASVAATEAVATTQYGTVGPRVVFLHGLFGQGRNWTQLGKALASDRRVTLVDLPDHGRSAWTTAAPGGHGFTLAGVADLLAAALGPEPFALVGHSLGGKVAMMMALRHPGLVERLAVVDISPVRYDRLREFSGYIDALRALPLDRIETRADADTALAASVSSESVRAFLLQNLRRDGERWRWQANLNGLERDLPLIGGWPEEDLVGRTPYPGRVLWIAGERSDYVLPEYGPAMERWFPRTQRVTIKRAGHWVHSEQPEVFGEVLRRFLAVQPEPVSA